MSCWPSPGGTLQLATARDSTGSHVSLLTGGFCWVHLHHVTCGSSCVRVRLAAIALLVLQSEEDAFWCLVAVVEAIMPQDYYTKNLVASQVRTHAHLIT